MNNEITYEVGRYFILVHGRDCDGQYARPSVTVFNNKSEAYKYFKSSVEYSDGIQYDLTDNLNEVREYCEYNDLNFLENITI